MPEPALASPPAVVDAHGGDVSLGLHGGGLVWLRSLEPAAACEDRADMTAEDAERQTVGRVAYRRVYGPRAALALDVEDPYWQLGLPEELLRVAGLRAAAGGIRTFLIRVPASDLRMLELLVDRLAADSRRHGSCFDVELPTTPRDGCGATR